jgi:hypothetical protein
VKWEKCTFIREKKYDSVNRMGMHSLAFVYRLMESCALKERTVEDISHYQITGRNMLKSCGDVPKLCIINPLVV